MPRFTEDRRSLFLARPILPEQVQEDRVRLNILTALERIGADIKRDFQRTVATWNHKVTFTVQKRLTRKFGAEGELGVFISTDSLIWGWLNEGTDIRFVRMTEDFEPKTVANVFDSFEGAGGVQGWGNMPGIEPRYWTQKAELDYTRPLRIAVTDAILFGLENQRLPSRGR